MGIQILSEGYRFRKGTGTPFSTITPFSTGGRSVCSECKGEVNTITRYYYQGSVYGFKEWCRSCGTVISGGIHFHTPSLTAMPNSTFYKAVEWMKTKEAKG